MIKMAREKNGRKIRIKILRAQNVRAQNVRVKKFE